MFARSSLAAATFALCTASAVVAGPPPQADAGFRVRIAWPALAAAVQDALKGASRRLQQDRCSAIFGDFTDGMGRNLEANLAALKQSGPGYLALVGWYDGKAIRPCQRGRTLAVTTPGSRNVWICPQFAFEQRRDPLWAEVTLVHEALHTLGLGEDPPSAAQISARVLARCAR